VDLPGRTGLLEKSAGLCYGHEHEERAAFTIQRGGNKAPGGCT
jgi:hypothetical protein